MVITLRLHLAVSLGAQLLYLPMVTTLGPPFGSALLAVIGTYFQSSSFSSFRCKVIVITIGRVSLTPKIGSGPPDVCPLCFLYFTVKVLITIYNYLCHLFCLFLCLQHLGQWLAHSRSSINVLSKHEQMKLVTWAPHLF